MAPPSVNTNRGLFDTMSDVPVQSIPIVLAGRTYPVLVTEEESLRVQAINERLNQELADLQGRYSNQLSTQDLLAMLLITYANRLEEEQQRNNLQPVKERIEALENLLEQVFDQ